MKDKMRERQKDKKKERKKERKKGLTAIPPPPFLSPEP
jgi:hypothetical protein